MGRLVEGARTRPSFSDAWAGPCRDFGLFANALEGAKKVFPSLLPRDEDTSAVAPHSALACSIWKKIRTWSLHGESLPKANARGRSVMKGMMKRRQFDSILNVVAEFALHWAALNGLHTDAERLPCEARGRSFRDSCTSRATAVEGLHPLPRRSDPPIARPD